MDHPSGSSHAEAEDDAGEETPLSRRGRLRIAVAVLVVLALIAFVPVPVSRMVHHFAAVRLLDEVAGGRTALLAKQDEFRTPLGELGDPVRSWTQVSCWLEPRYSDGDGEQDIVVFYRQECALVAYELYPAPPDAEGIADVARRLGGRVAEESPTCSEVLFGVLEPDFGASGDDEYATGLWWVDPAGEPPADEPDRCAMPAPDAPDAARVVRDIDGRMGDGAHIVYSVRSPVSDAWVGCERGPFWFMRCTAEPDGYPVL